MTSDKPSKPTAGQAETKPDLLEQMLRPFGDKIKKLYGQCIRVEWDTGLDFDGQKHWIIVDHTTSAVQSEGETLAQAIRRFAGQRRARPRQDDTSDEQIVRDKERLDWLSELSTFYYQEHRNPYVGSPSYGKVERRELFTIPSQHVQGETLRDAIDAAIKKAKQ
jgi:hypothetical protein